MAYLLLRIDHTIPSLASYRHIRVSINTYDHMHLTTRDPVRSPIYKQVTAGLVVASVTSSESLVLYVYLRIVFFFWLFVLFFGRFVRSSDFLAFLSSRN